MDEKRYIRIKRVLFDIFVSSLILAFLTRSLEGMILQIVLVFVIPLICAIAQIHYFRKTKHEDQFELLVLIMNLVLYTLLIILLHQHLLTI